MEFEQSAQPYPERREYAPFGQHMKRIYIILGISHVLFIGAAVALYAGTPLAGMFLGLVAVFVRLMVPYSRRIANKSTRKIFSGIELLGWVILYLWLDKVGLDELIDKACAERFSTLPIVGVSVILSVASIRDWKRMFGLSNDEVETFYAKKAEPRPSADR